MAVFLTCVLLALPFWLRLARHRDKARVFVAGSLIWAGVSVFAAALGPETPRWAFFAWAAAAAVGYAVVDLMPWSMVGDVIDEDDLAHGERREGLYNGVFTFLRKLGGALGVMVVMAILDLTGLRERRDAERDRAAGDPLAHRARAVRVPAGRRGLRARLPARPRRSRADR